MPQASSKPATPWLYGRWALRTLLALYGMAGVLVFIPSVYLLLYAETWRGRVFSIAVLFLLALPFAALAGHRFRTRRMQVAGILAATPLFPLFLLVLLGFAAPDGKTLPDARVGSVYLMGQHQRFTPANLVPEIDQIKLGILLTPFYDGLIDDAQRRTLLQSAMTVYGEMEDETQYRALGSVLGDAYAELYGGAFDRGHCYFFLPPHASGERLPLVVFLHGAGGNFLAYMRVLETLAQQYRCVVIAPSFGFGGWGSGGSEAVERVRAYAMTHLPVDSERVTLMGLSNGGLGVSRTLAQYPDCYAAAVFISAAVDDTALSSDVFRNGWGHKPILVIEGVSDNRIPLGYVQGYAQRLKAQGAKVEFIPYENQDHFLFFSNRDRVCRDMADWLIRNKR